MTGDDLQTSYSDEDSPITECFVLACLVFDPFNGQSIQSLIASIRNRIGLCPFVHAQGSVSEVEAGSLSRLEVVCEGRECCEGTLAYLDVSTAETDCVVTTLITNKPPTTQQPNHSPTLGPNFIQPSLEPQT